MTVIYLTKIKCRWYGVFFENDGCVRVQKFGDIPDYEKKSFCVKPLGTFLGKRENCEVTKVSGAYDKKIVDGNTNLLKKSDGNDKQTMGGDKVCSFLTNDDIYKYISNKGNISTPYSIAIGSEYSYF